jgi:hypothetical protein
LRSRFGELTQIKGHAAVAVPEPLARGLSNTLVDAKAEDDLARRDALLDESRALARAHSDDAAVRQPLASIIASLGWKILPTESVSTGADRPRSRLY